MIYCFPTSSGALRWIIRKLTLQSLALLISPWIQVDSS